MKKIINKYNKLKSYLRDLESVLVAFSGGLDSSLLSKIAYDVLGSKVIAVTAISNTYPKREYIGAKKITRHIGIKHITIKTNEFKNKKFIANNPNRCYFCKKELFSQLKLIAEKYKIKHIIDGSNLSDKADIRPGEKANQEFNVISPLYVSGFTKDDIRDLAKYLNLNFWDKPAEACLASRICFNDKITPRKLKMVEKAEDILKASFGRDFLVRARHHDDVLRIEIEKENWTKLQKSDITKVINKLKKVGYRYITLDLEGYIPAGKR